MGYTHPMDDGQERTFKVKFEGEGVDDYGGPYREFFSQVVEELQSKIGESNSGYNVDRSAPNNVTSCVLPLLVPCPNQQKSTGENQKHFVLNPSTVRSYAGSAQLYTEMYSFLGQIIGIALSQPSSLIVSIPIQYMESTSGRTIRLQ